jgi:hypothetical protein
MPMFSADSGPLLQKGKGKSSNGNALTRELMELYNQTKAGTGGKYVVDKLVGRALPSSYKHLSVDEVARALHLTKAKPREGYKKLSAEKKETGVPSGDPIPPKEYAVQGSLAPPESHAEARSVVGSSVGVALLSDMPSVGWTPSIDPRGKGGHDSITLEGTDYYRAISNTEIKQAAGNNIIPTGVPINPAHLGLPRLAALAHLFERFEFVSSSSIARPAPPVFPEEWSVIMSLIPTTLNPRVCRPDCSLHSVTMVSMLRNTGPVHGLSFRPTPVIITPTLGRRIASSIRESSCC